MTFSKLLFVFFSLKELNQIEAIVNCTFDKFNNLVIIIFYRY